MLLGGSEKRSRIVSIDSNHDKSSARRQAIVNKCSNAAFGNDTPRYCMIPIWTACDKPCVHELKL